MIIDNIQSDSRKVKPGDTFIALKGISSDGHEYINAAIEKGATKIIASFKNDYLDESIIEYVSDTSEYLNNLLFNNYLKDINKMKLIGVTGTNGKTTTCFLTYQILNNLGVNAAYIGTNGFYYKDVKKDLNNTTPELLELYKLLVCAYNNGITHVVMEVSSHALDQNRVEGLSFSAGAFTNLTQDHLDYHKSMDNYLNAKLKIFNYLNNSPFIVNVDVPYSEKFLKNNYFTLGEKGTDYKLISEELKEDKTKITFVNNNNTYEVTINLISHFNVINYLTSLGLINKLGFEINDIIRASMNIYPPKGRIETIKVGNGLAIIDYAHTPDAVEKIIMAFKENKLGKIITVIGCGGDRDPLKRPIMGNLATSLSDHVIFTNDNPRTEDPNKIIADIIEGVYSNNYQIENDREKAINMALDLIHDKDIVLILGKGHEEYQEINHVKHHFSDREIVNNYLIK